MTTLTASVIGVVMFGIQVLAWIGSVKLGTRWAKIKTTWSRVTWLAVLVFSVFGLARVFGIISSDHGTNAMIAAACFMLFASLLFPLLAIRKWFSATGLQTFKIWLASLLATVVGVLLAFFVRTFFLEAFVVPTNAMAPTIVGASFTGTCPECGETTYISPTLLDPQMMNSRPSFVICSAFHTTELTPDAIQNNSAEQTARDRILVSKLIQPQRWDVLVFRNPAAPQTNYVKRVVGFPGETLQLKDGSIWINGTRCEPPDHLKGLRYETDMAPYLGHQVTLAGATEIVLGDDEYFMLGDNTVNAFDSRLWPTGAAGYPPYAVPEDHIIGVVTHIYWPKNRMRVLK